MKQKKWTKEAVINLSVILVFGIFLIASIASKYASPDHIDKQYVTEHYDITFSDMLEEQMKNSTMPQTASAGSWYDASENLTEYYANPKNVEKDSKASYQFLKLSGSSNASADQLDDHILDGKGVLENKGENFKQASEKHNLNEVYLVAHALHETGDGASELAEGVEVGENEEGKPKLVTSSNREELEDIKTTYNFFGFGADDSRPIKHGAKRAYEEEWFSPKEAIIGGADYIDGGFVSEGQDTLYKMRWNPENPGKGQYATDVAWASEQTDEMERVYDQLQDEDDVEMTFEIPEFNEQPESNAKPVDADVFHVDEELEDIDEKGKITEDKVHFRKGPTTSFESIKKLSEGDKVTIIGENTGWYNVETDEDEGWVLGEYVE